MNTSKQDKYYSVYRNRHSWIYHLAYMRLSKVLAALYAIEKQGLSLLDESILDYGFGAGTFFRYCPKECALFGVELDAVNMEAVKRALGRMGYRQVDLRVISEKEWQDHELLTRQYDLIVASHVLEHMEEPALLMNRLLSCLTPQGCLLAVVPINEVVPHESHVSVIERQVIEDWAQAVNATIMDYRELDRFTYCARPILHKTSRVGRLFAQGVSLGLGIPAALLGARRWFILDALFGRATGAKPAQAVFLMRPHQARAFEPGDNGTEVQREPT
jgi:SAM-dependent methyltransferase